MTYSVLPVLSRKGNSVYERTTAAKYIPMYYDKMEKEGLIKHAFYDGGVKNFEDFARFALNKDIVFLLAFRVKDNTAMGPPVGHLYITGIQGYCGMAHFSINRDKHRDAVEIMSDSLDTVFSVKRTDGTPFLTTLLGVTPVTNFPAIKTIKQVGFEHVATIEKMCHLYYSDRYVDGYLSRRISNGRIDGGYT